MHIVGRLMNEFSKNWKKLNIGPEKFKLIQENYWKYKSNSESNPTNHLRAYFLLQQISYSVFEIQTFVNIEHFQKHFNRKIICEAYVFKLDTH